MSRSTGLAALRNEPHAHEPLAPSAFCQISSPRSSRPRSCSRMRMTSADRLRYGLRPRLATLTAMRPPGSSLRTHSAKTSVSMLEVLEVRRRHAVALELLLVLLAGEVRRRRDDEGDRAVGDARPCAGRRRARTARSTGSGARTVSSSDELGRPEAVVERRRRRGSRGAPTPKFEVAVGRRPFIPAQRRTRRPWSRPFLPSVPEPTGASSTGSCGR